MKNLMVVGWSPLAASCCALALAACSPAVESPAAPVADNSAPASEPMVMAQTSFSAAETAMHEAMMVAMGANVSETWARKMIPHHQGALDMAKIVMGETQDADIRRMAQKSLGMQTRDITELRSWLGTKAGAAPEASPTAAGGEQQPFAAAEAKMKDAMMTAMGANVDQTWTRKMIAHHQGALDMANIVSRQTQDAEIRRMAQKTIDMQTADIGELEMWLDAHPANAG